MADIVTGICSATC